MSIPRVVALAAMVGIAGFASIASAHTIADPDEGPAGGYFRTAFRVTHGCKGSPTVAVAVRLPDGVLSARPQPKPGWTISVEMRRLDPPIRSAHGAIHETATEVTWRGGPLANAHFDDFVLTMRLPDRAGETLHFPVVQTCENGRHEWIGVPAPGQNRGDLPEPAPFVKLRPPAARSN